MAALKIVLLEVMALAILVVVHGQENSSPGVAKSLLECYENRALLHKNNLLPMTMDTLIDLIRKVENTRSYVHDITQLTVALLHRFRQDGIQRDPKVAASPGVLPYSPVGLQSLTYRILLQRLLPGSANNFPNETLTLTERCSLHSMLSSSFDMTVRGDESTINQQSAQLRSSRIPRSAPADIQEIGERTMIKNRFRRSNEADALGNEVVNEVDTISEPSGISQYPVENGVLWTPWGAVAAGNLLAGIAAGLQPQQVKLKSLVALARRADKSPVPQLTGIVENKWAVTLAGDLSEAALYQGVKRGSNDKISVGAPGFWNSTTLPRWYLLSQQESLEVTDAEIRGGLDGLIIASKITKWHEESPTLKLSQLLTMYYSERGVFNSGVRSCDRRERYSEIASVNDIQAQTASFSFLLDREATLTATIQKEAIDNFASHASDAFLAYLPQSLNDVSCQTTIATQNDKTNYRVMTDLYVFLDTTWPFRDVNGPLMYLLRSLNVNLYGSRVTILSAADGSIIVNTTSYLSEIYENWNATRHSQGNMGLQMSSILTSIQNITRTILESEKTVTPSSVASRSLISLVVPFQASINDGDVDFVMERLQLLREEAPDHKLLFWAGGSLERFERFVQDKQDLLTLQPDNKSVANINAVVDRIKKIPRRLINHRCGANWTSPDFGTTQANQMIELGSVSFYRLHPNYFFQKYDNRKVRIQGQGILPLTVCYSRSEQLPRINNTAGDNIVCKQILSDAIEMDLSDACNDYNTISECPPLYISIESVLPAKDSETKARCIDNECILPDDVLFKVQHENLGCYSSATTLYVSLNLLVIGFIQYLLFRIVF